MKLFRLKSTVRLLFFITLFYGCNKKNKVLNTPPNIILIMADDMGYETLGSYGNLSNNTPVLDSLASTGIQFKNCVSQPLCTPSRVKIMTGLYNYRNYDYFGHLNSKEKTFGNLMQEAGYATCIAGKWQLNGLSYKDEIKDWNDSLKPNKLGFDQYCLWQLTKSRPDGGRFANPLIEKNGQFLKRDKNAFGPDIFSQFIVDFMEEKKDQPFFVYYPMVMVHDPFIPTPDSKKWNDPEQRYQSDTTNFKGMVEYTDKIVGRIVRKLKELKLSDNTIVIFTGDNGTHPTIFSKTTKGVIQGGKGNTTAAGTHVPLIINWGKQIKEPFVYDGLIEFSDFYSTFADIVNKEIPSDGKSFLPLLDNSNYEERETAFVHYDPKWGKNVSSYRNQFVRTKTHKLYKNGAFYNLIHDILEEKPLHIDSLSNSEIAIRSKLVQTLKEHPKLD